MAESQPTKAKSRRGIYIGVGIAVAVVGIIIIIAIANMGRLYSSPSANSNPGGGIIPTEHKQNIVNGLISVDANGYNFYSFSAPSGSYNAKVEGRFEASGGSGNDVRVAILDANGFTNYKNNHEASGYYSTGQQTVGDINVNIPSGETLYLVYDNTFSAFSDKNVRTTVDLIYTN